MTMLTLVTIQIVTMLYPLRQRTVDHAYFGYHTNGNHVIPLPPKIGDHAYFGYQGSTLFSLHIVFFINGNHVTPLPPKNR